MTNRTHTGLLLLVLAAGLVGCDASSPLAPTAVVPEQTPRPTPGGPVTGVADVTLSGVVYEVTPTGRVPIEDVRVFMTDDQDIGTDANGFFSFRPVWVVGGNTMIWVGKDGYDNPAGQPAVPGYNGPGWRVVTINGDTRVEIELVRR